MSQSQLCQNYIDHLQDRMRQDAYQEMRRIKDLSALNIGRGASRRKINQYLTLYQFQDGSFIKIYHERGRGYAYMRGGEILGTANLKINSRGL